MEYERIQIQECRFFTREDMFTRVLHIQQSRTHLWAVGWQCRPRRPWPTSELQHTIAQHASIIMVLCLRAQATTLRMCRLFERVVEHAT